MLNTTLCMPHTTWPANVRDMYNTLAHISMLSWSCFWPTNGLDTTQLVPYILLRRMICLQILYDFFPLGNASLFFACLHKPLPNPPLCMPICVPLPSTLQTCSNANATNRLDSNNGFQWDHYLLILLVWLNGTYHTIASQQKFLPVDKCLGFYGEEKIGGAWDCNILDQF